MINQLTIQGFEGQRGCETYPFDKYTFVMGPNAAGKSTMINGIKTAMFGVVPDCVINAGSKDAVAIVKMDNGVEIKTVASEDAPTAHYVNGKKGTKKDIASLRGSLLKLSPELAEIFFRNNSYVWDMKPEELSKLIGSILPALSADDLLKALKVTPDEEALFKSVYADTNVDFDGIAKVYKDLSEKLRVLNRDIASAEQTAKILCVGNSGRPLELLKKRRDELVNALKVFRDREDAQKEYEAKKASYERYMQEARSLQDQLANKPAAVQPGLIDDNIERLNRIAEKLKSESELIAVLQMNIETSEKIIRELSSSVCPISKKLVCTTDKSSVRAELEHSVEETSKMLEIHKQQIVSLESIKQTTETTIRDLREKERKQQEYLRLEERLAALRANMPPLPVAPTAASGDSSAITAELDTVNTEIANAGNAEQSKKLMASLKSEKAKQAVVEHLRSMLAPKGEAYNIILDKVCGSLNKEMNATAAELGVQREYEFRVDNGMTLFGKKTGNAEMIPVRNQSTGERFIAHLILITLVNKVVGTSFVILDNIDCLDEANLQKVLRLIMSPAYEKRFENIILAGVNHTDTVSAINTVAAGRSDVKVINLVA